MVNIQSAMEKDGHVLDANGTRCSTCGVLYEHWADIRSDRISRACPIPKEIVGAWIRRSKRYEENIQKRHS